MSYLFIVFGFKKIEKYKLLTGYGFITIIMILLLGLSTVTLVSYFEGKIVWNVFQTQRGRVYVTIDIILIIIFLLDHWMFSRRNWRQPKNKGL
jgi:hypothetical protein